MAYNNEVISQRLFSWLDSMEHFALPDWEQLPQLELYMDQVIILLKQYLSPLYHGEDDKAITASIINNYVRMKVMPPPVKKKYSRVHLASLIMICVLKQSLSISCIQRILPSEQGEDAFRRIYNDFVCQYRTVREGFVQQARKEDSPLLSYSAGSLLASCAIISNLSTGLTEYLLHEETEDPPKK